MAQAKRPSSAQLERMLGPGQQATLVVYPLYQRADATYVAVATETLKLPEEPWQPLPRVSRLGIELLYAKPSTATILLSPLEMATTSLLVF